MSGFGFGGWRIGDGYKARIGLRGRGFYVEKGYCFFKDLMQLFGRKGKDGEKMETASLNTPFCSVGT